MRSNKPWCAEPQERDMWLPGTRVCSGGKKPWSRDESSVMGDGQRRVAHQSSQCWVNWPSNLLVGEVSPSYVDQFPRSRRPGESAGIACQGYGTNVII